MADNGQSPGPSEERSRQFSSENASNNSSANPSRPGSVGGADRAKQRSRNNRVKFSVGADDEEEATSQDAGVTSTNLEAKLARKPLPTPRISLADTDAAVDVTEVVLKEPDWTGRTTTAALSAQDRASRLASRLSHSAPGSRRSSVEDITKLNQDTKHENSAKLKPTPPTSNPPLQYAMDGLWSPNSSPPLRAGGQYPAKMDDIPLMDMSQMTKLQRQSTGRPYSLYEESTDEDSEGPTGPPTPHNELSQRPTVEAHRLVRGMTRGMSLYIQGHQHAPGTETPAIDRNLHDYDYVPAPTQYKAGILSSLLKLYEQQGAQPMGRGHAEPSMKKKQAMAAHEVDQARHRSQSETPGSSAQSSGKGTPKKPKWYHEQRSPARSPNSQSTSSLAQLLQSSTSAAMPGMRGVKHSRPNLPRSKSSGMIAAAVDKIAHPVAHMKRPRLEDEIRITVHIAEVLARQEYIIKLCRGLMLYGAPTHRLEEYMITTARSLEIDGHFLYLPGCMIVSFDDPDTHTTEVKLVKENHGVDLGRFKDVFMVYKNVIHDVCGVEEATKDLEDIYNKDDKFPVWIRVTVYGIASVAVGPFAFGARPVDFPIIFCLGCLLGFLQLVVVPRSGQFQHVFEVAAAVLTSFLARAFGSITHNGKYIFCFSAIAQSSIALILPGYIILCASLELQSRNIVAGSVRMVYAIIYSLFLGFGITIGTAIFGLMDPQATSKITCEIPYYWTNTYLTHFPFVPIFTLCLIVINQAKWKQAPAMLIIAFAGYQTNFWSSRRFAGNIQVANALGAFAIGALANLYSRFYHGLAAAAMLPAIFVQVPSGLAASGSLVAGLTSADQITGNATGISVINNGTQGFQDAQNATTSSQAVYNGTIFNVGYGMVQVAIGISVGLFLSALVVYPLGKRRSGLFSF